MKKQHKDASFEERDQYCKARNEKENHQYETRNSVEAETFWRGIWSERKEHHKDVE